MLNNKSLYLNGNKIKRISLDYEAIKVEHCEQSPQWFPLVRLSRLILMGKMILDSDLVLACMQRNIPISFLYSDGRLAALTNGFQAEDSCFAVGFQKLYSSLGGQDVINDWFYAIERQNQIRVIKELGFNVENYSPDFLLDLFAFYLEALYKLEDARFVFEILQNSLLTHLSVFVANILKVHEKNENLMLNSTLSYRYMMVLRWQLFRLYLKKTKKKSRVPEISQVVGFYEKNSAKMESCFFKLSNHFYFWMLRRDIDAG